MSIGGFRMRGESATNLDTKIVTGVTMILMVSKMQVGFTKIVVRVSEHSPRNWNGHCFFAVLDTQIFQSMSMFKSNYSPSQSMAATLPDPTFAVHHWADCIY